MFYRYLIYVAAWWISSIVTSEGNLEYEKCLQAVFSTSFKCEFYGVTKIVIFTISDLGYPDTFKVIYAGDETLSKKKLRMFNKAYLNLLSSLYNLSSVSSLRITN